MAFREFFRRRRERQKWKRRDKLSRIDYLLEVYHEMLEGGRDSLDGLNFLELVERQLSDGETDLALFNITRQWQEAFTIANLYWGQGDRENAEKYLRKTLERYQRWVDAGREHGKPLETYRNVGAADVKTAAMLLDAPLDGPVLSMESEPGYSPAFGEYLIDCCLGTHDFDMGRWQSIEDAWLKNRFPKYMFEEKTVYVKALTGAYADDAEMLADHTKMWLGKAKKDPESGLLDGYRDNELIIDATFAAVLKRIGWEGTYRHSWPGTCPVDMPPVTTRPADRHLGVIAPPPPAPDADTGIIADPQEARRYIDLHAAEQRDWWTKEQSDAQRPAKERSKVSGILKELGWKADPATLDLMRSYRMDKILNNSTHVFLSDPIGDRYCGLKPWTELFRDEFGLHADFIPVVESEEKRDYRDPQGGWYVYWKKDKRIYCVQRDDWGDPAAATRDARPGKEVWPSYLSFVAWWVAQHQAGDQRGAEIVIERA